MSKAGRKKSSVAAPPEPALPLWLPAPAGALAAGLWLAFIVTAYARKKLAFAAGDWTDMAATLAAAPGVLGGAFAKNAALGALTWVGAAGWGCALRRRLVGSSSPCAECFVVNSGLGLGALSLALLALAAAGAFTTVALRWLWGAGVLGGGTLCWMAWWQAPPDNPARAEARGGPLVWAAWALIALIATGNFVAALAPEVFYDSLVYHLALPQLYLLRGGLSATPENIYSGLPQGVQMLYGLALSLSGDDLAAFLHALFGLMTAVGLYSTLRRLAGPRVGALGALLFYGCPLIVYASWACGVDLASAFYITGALALVTGVAGEAAERSGGRSVMAGLLVGFAAGTKFNVAPVAGALVLGHAWLELRAGRGWRGPALMCAAAGAATAPWLLKNAALYGNPFYPFLHRAFGTLHPADWRAFLESAGSRDLRAAFTTWPGLRDFLILPYNCTLGNWPLGDWPGPVFAALTPAALAVSWGGAREGEPYAWRLTAALAALGFASWWLASSLVRYLVPALPLIAAAVALAVERGAWPRWAKGAAWAALFVGSLLGYQCAWRQGGGIGQWAYARGKVSRDEYLTRQRVTYGLPSYAAARWVNANLPPRAKVIVLGESRGFYLERDFVAATVYDHNPFWTAAAAAADPADLRARLRALGVTHLLLNARQLHFRHDLPAVLPRATAASPLVDDFVRRWLDVLWEERVDRGEHPSWLTVYKLRDEAAPSPAAVNPVRAVLDILARQGA
ncbi:hypothetical protein EPO15_00935 [bacterium]|nr:MAG: hypothetical protein EPO15_00935 [bacterium]